MSVSKFATAAMLAALLVAPRAPAEEVKSRQELAETFPGLSLENIKDGPIPGLYELILGSQVAYVTDDGRYLIKGEIIDLQSSVNITEQRRVQARAQVLSTLDEDNMIIFEPKDPADVRYTVTVLTDIDCGYCRKLHRHMAQFTDMGVRVRYLLYPRSGPGTPSWEKAARVWCAADRQSALTAAKNDQPFASGQCETGPVMQQYETGIGLGTRGTPAILTERGDYIGGYLTPEQMLQKLEISAMAQPGAQ